MADRIECVLLTAKLKSVERFAAEAEIAIVTEDPPADADSRDVQPNDIYRRETDYWLWEVAVDLLKHRPEIGLIDVHITN